MWLGVGVGARGSCSIPGVGETAAAALVLVGAAVAVVATEHE